MNDFIPVLSPITWGLAAVAAVLFILNSLRPTRAGGATASLLLLGAALLLAGAAALPAWLPRESSSLQAEGSPTDPRVLSTWLLVAAAFAGLLGSIRSLRAPALALIGFWAQGVVLGGLVATAAFMAGLRTSSGLVGLFLGGLLFGTALALASRRRGDRATTALATVAVGVAIVVVAALVSLHGARVSRITVTEGSSVDTLGHQVKFVSTSAPHDSLRVMRLALVSANGRTDSLAVSVLGRTGPKTSTTADGGALAGAIIVPIALEELQANPHGITWLKKGESMKTAAGAVRFKAFRFQMGDPIKLFADLEVEHAGKVTAVSPGMTASDKGESPLPATVEGFGPIAVAAVDADNGRVGLLLPSGATTASVVRTALLELRTRPLLPGVWIGCAVALVGFLLVAAGPGPAKSEAATLG